MVFEGDEVVTVSEVISSRYPDHLRPFSWKDRIEGIDTVRTIDGRVLTLFSSAQQSVPRRGWRILIHKVDYYYTWTLFGFSDEAEFTPDDF